MNSDISVDIKPTDTKKEGIYQLLSNLRSFLQNNDPESGLIEDVDELLKMKNGIEVYSGLFENCDEIILEKETTFRNLRIILQKICYLLNYDDWHFVKYIDEKYVSEMRSEIQRFLNQIYMKLEQDVLLDTIDLQQMHTNFYHSRLLLETDNDLLKKIKTKYLKDVLPKKEKMINKTKTSFHCSFCLSPAMTICCSLAAYCSRECQANDWKKGHSIECHHDEFVQNIQENEV